jgi:hypothetical protein
VALLENVRKDWRKFKNEAPGRRFQERYRRRQERGHGWLNPRRLFNVVVGLALVVFSAFFGWAPGPGVLTFFIGLGMIAGEVRPVARFLDWGEVWGRKLLAGFKDVWKVASYRLRGLILAASLACVALPLYAGYQVFFGA